MKNLVALILLLFSQFSHSSNWYLLTDETLDPKVFVDLDSQVENNEVGTIEFWDKYVYLNEQSSGYVKYDSVKTKKTYFCTKKSFKTEFQVLMLKSENVQQFEVEKTKPIVPDTYEEYIFKILCDGITKKKIKK